MNRDRSYSHASENDSEPEETVRSLLIHAMEITTNDSIRTAISSIGTHSLTYSPAHLLTHSHS
jgi:hypothetical protein